LQNYQFQATNDLATIISHMAAHDQLLEKIGKLIDPLRAQLYEQGANIIRVVQSQKRLETEQKEQGVPVAVRQKTTLRTDWVLSAMKVARGSRTKMESISGLDHQTL
jgi:hypothetical protein